VIEVKIKRRHRRVRAFLKLRPTEAVLKSAQTAGATFYCNEKREMPPKIRLKKFALLYYGKTCILFII
jgi:hypothetical protein